MTIKTQNGKVITKDGKVSCECCEVEECCMYPAEAYGTLYQFEDLPDEIEFKYTNPQGGFFGPLTMSKIQEGLSVGYRGGPNDEVVVFNNSSFSWDAADGGGAIPGGGFCLIFDYDAELDILFEAITEDLFANTYSISGPISGTVTRRDKFRTTVDEFAPITIKYNCGLWTEGELRLSFNATKCKWTVNGNEKAGFQNTPVGSYAGGYTVS
jgi:hypothetical protein